VHSVAEPAIARADGENRRIVTSSAVDARACSRRFETLTNTRCGTLLPTHWGVGPARCLRGGYRLTALREAFPVDLRCWRWGGRGNWQRHRGKVRARGTGGSCSKNSRRARMATGPRLPRGYNIQDARCVKPRLAVLGAARWSGRRGRAGRRAGCPCSRRLAPRGATSSCMSGFSC
jgi:hypothetical protein